MILGDLPGIKKLLPENKEKINNYTFVGKRIELSKLEVIRLYHVSPIKNRASIFTYGLLPKYCLGTIISYPPRIYVSTTYEDAAFDYVHFEDVDLWVFYLPKHLLKPDEFSSFANHYYIEEPVAWHKLEILETR